jgi:DNA recombination protein RmuC
LRKKSSKVAFTPRIYLETTKLNNVLKSSKQRGRWGEMQVQKILEMSGLDAHIGYTEQGIDQSGTRPDFVVKLPNKRNIIIDSKFNADAYIRAVEATNDEDKQRHYRDHAEHVRATYKSLAKKKYTESDDCAIDFVIMFIPNDSLLASAAEIDSNIVEEALSYKIVLATPSTLYAMLKAIALGWQEFELNQNAEKVKVIGVELFKRAITLVEHFSEIQKGLTRAIKGYNNTIGSFQTKFLPQLNKFKEFGVVSEEIGEPDLIEELVRDINYESKYLSESSEARSQKSVGPADLP